MPRSDSPRADPLESDKAKLLHIHQISGTDTAVNKFLDSSFEFFKNGRSLASVAPVILLVDDDADFTLLVQTAFARTWPDANLRCASDGDEAIHYLLGQEPYSDRGLFPIPSLMLLDLRMPRVSGFEVLEWKREIPELNALPVVVWSSSNLLEDAQHARSCGAVTYLVKPTILEEYVEYIGHFKNVLELPAEIRTSPWVWSGLSNIEHTLTAKWHVTSYFSFGAFRPGGA